MPTTGRAASCSAARARSTPWSGSGASARISTPGRAAGNPGWGYDDLLPAFKAIEDNEAGADDMARHRRAAPCHRLHAARPSADQRYLEAGQQAGLPLNPDFNGAEPGRRRRLPDLDPERPAHVGGARLPAPGDEARQCPRRDQRAGDAESCSRASAPSASNIVQQRRDADGARRPRGDPVRRLDQLAAAAAAVRRRPGRPARRPRHPGRARQRQCRRATCRTMSASTTPSRARDADAQPDPAALVGQAAGRHALPADCATARCRCR